METPGISNQLLQNNLKRLQLKRFRLTK